MYLPLFECSARQIRPFSDPNCLASVQEWTKKVTDRDKSVAPGHTYSWGTSQSTSVMFDAIMCNTWYADCILKKAIDESDVRLAKKAALQYKYVHQKLWPRWTHRPANAQTDALTTERCALGKYCLARATEFDALLSVASEKKYSSNVQRQLCANSAHLYGNAAQLIGGQYETLWNMAVARSAAGAVAHGKHLSEIADKLGATYTDAWAESAACFAEARARYESCNMLEDAQKCIVLYKSAADANCSTHNAAETLPDWEFMSPLY